MVSMCFQPPLFQLMTRRWLSVGPRTPPAHPPSLARGRRCFLLYIQPAVLGFFCDFNETISPCGFCVLQSFHFLLKQEYLYFGVQGGLILLQNPQDLQEVSILPYFGLFQMGYLKTPARDRTINCHTSTRQHGYLRLLQTF